jgi:hypothetical protein
MAAGHVRLRRGVASTTSGSAAWPATVRTNPWSGFYAMFRADVSIRQLWCR